MGRASFRPCFERPYPLSVNASGGISSSQGGGGGGGCFGSSGIVGMFAGAGAAMAMARKGELSSRQQAKIVSSMNEINLQLIHLSWSYLLRLID